MFFSCGFGFSSSFSCLLLYLSCVHASEQAITMIPSPSWSLLYALQSFVHFSYLHGAGIHLLEYTMDGGLSVSSIVENEQSASNSSVNLNRHFSSRLALIQMKSGRCHLVTCEMQVCALQWLESRCGLVFGLGVPGNFRSAGYTSVGSAPPTSRQPPPSTPSTNPTASHLSKWVASGLRRSRSRPRSSSSATTRASLSTSRPTSASAMRSLLSPPSACATRYACTHSLERGDTPANSHCFRLPATPPT